MISPPSSNSILPTRPGLVGGSRHVEGSRADQANERVAKLDGLVGLDAEIEARTALGGGRRGAAEPLQDQCRRVVASLQRGAVDLQIAADVEVVGGAAEAPGAGEPGYQPRQDGITKPVHLAGEVEGDDPGPPVDPTVDQAAALHESEAGTVDDHLVLGQQDGAVDTREDGLAPGKTEGPLGDLGDAFEMRPIEGAEHLHDAGGPPGGLPFGNQEAEEEGIQGAGGVAVDRPVRTDPPAHEDPIVAVAEVEVLDLEALGREREVGRPEEADGIVLEIQAELLHRAVDDRQRTRRPVDGDVDTGGSLQGNPGVGEDSRQQVLGRSEPDLTAAGKLTLGRADELDRAVDGIGQTAVDDPAVGFGGDIDAACERRRFETAGGPASRCRADRRAGRWPRRRWCG